MNRHRIINLTAAALVVWGILANIGTAADCTAIYLGIK